MNGLYFKLSFRGILKNRISSTINIVGFAIGMAACLFMFLFIRFETSFDKSYPNRDSLYRLVGSHNANNVNTRSSFVWYPMAEDLKNEVPGIEDYSRISKSNTVKCYIEKEIGTLNKLRYGDNNFFQFFNFKLLVGNPDTALDSEDKIVLTKSKAKQLFGEKNPLGATLMFDHKLFTVSGIAEEPPSNTHLLFDAIVSVKYIEKSELFWTGYGGGMTFLSYLELSKNTTPQHIEKALPNFLNKKINERWKNSGMFLSATLQNIQEVHLADGTIDYDNSTNRSKKSVYVVLSICLLILILAIINYVILFSAQKINKTKDIRLLEILGARKYSLLLQTFIEVLIIATIASVLGAILLYAASPFLNGHFKTSILIGDELFSVIIFLFLSILLLSALVTLISSKRYIFSRPFKFLANKRMLTLNNPKRKKEHMLISFQFTIVMILIISVIIISSQNNLLLNAELGFEKENIITIKADDSFFDNELMVFKEEVNKFSEIQSVSLSSEIIGGGITQNGYLIGDEKEATMINVLYTDAHFIECYKVNLNLGRNFNSNTSLDKNAIIINQQLAKRSGWKNPLSEKLNRNGTLDVIGVVEDFNFASLEDKVQPLLIMSNPNWDGFGYSVVNLRVKTSDAPNLISRLETIWKTKFPETPIDISFLDDRLASNYISFISQQRIINFFSLIGILIAVIGLFGLTIFTAQSRIKEIGIRKVNGAKISEIMVLLNKDFIKWVAMAYMIACPIAYYIMGKWLESFAHKITLSWWIFGLAGAMTLSIALLTVSWQSFRAATANPIDALRDE